MVDGRIDGAALSRLRCAPTGQVDKTTGRRQDDDRTTTGREDDDRTRVQTARG